MTDFLSDLERELLAAHPRRGAARRRATAARVLRAAPAALVVAAVLAGAIAFVLTVGRDAPRHSAPATPSPPVPVIEPPALPTGSVAVLNGTTTPGLAAAVADFLSHRVRVAMTGDDVRTDLWRTVVRYAPGHQAEAKRLATALDAPARPLTAAVRNAAEAADVVVEVGRDVRGSRDVALTSASDGRAVGIVQILDRDAGRDVVSIYARLRRTDFDTVWLVSGEGPHPRGRLLGFAGPPEGSDPRVLETGFLADLRGRRLVVSREGRERPGPRPREIVAVADP
jgi:LytR cell envelope-related transcriptional attenuator